MNRFKRLVWSRESQQRHHFQLIFSFHKSLMPDIFSTLAAMGNPDHASDCASSQSASAQSSPEDNTETELYALLHDVSSALRDHAGKDVFAIGGKIDVSPGSPSEGTAEASVVVRWDSGELSQSRNVRLPVSDDTVSQGAFAQLLADCEPATFGINKTEVLDETYRKASKMDTDKFSTDFHPHEHGIMDTIVQALAHGDHTSKPSNLGVRAELYKLNVSDQPSFDNSNVIHRSIPDRRESSSPMLIHHVRPSRWAPS